MYKDWGRALLTGIVGLAGAQSCVDGVLIDILNEKGPLRIFSYFACTNLVVFTG